MKSKEDSGKNTWEPMKINDLGNVGDVVLGGEGKFSPGVEDTGDSVKKPQGQEV